MTKTPETTKTAIAHGNYIRGSASKVRRVLDILIVSVYFLSVVSGLSLTGTTISPTSAVRSTEEIRDVANEQEGRVRLTAAGALSAEMII